MGVLKTVLFVRHGVAEHNVVDPRTRDLRDPSLFDPSLVEAGRRQAIETGGVLRAWLAAHRRRGGGGKNAVENDDGDVLVVASPLTRCLETAQLAIGASNARVVCHEAVREACGVHQPDRRRSRAELRRRFPDVDFELAMDTDEDASWRPDRREKVDDVRIRVQRFLLWLTTVDVAANSTSSPPRRRDDDIALVFTHGVWMEILVHYCGLPIASEKNRRVRNCDVLVGTLEQDEIRPLRFTSLNFLT